ncbi:ribosome-inactivating family protein [Streptomyces europaeiscabiei]|uniref:ribosome-inactivating family protein n=1 Tax=Streptomyces europaeiscabiei TaxID=146819 RepID=UPI0006282E54|nr:ribosome-inactivating family protein [Streptomyces europaeiscabiei]MDX2757219.1 ribosome-inactivating family protein [Streptomyces europaeiscabiei]MDX2768263.1 ribosome-inactivating family protein [Streptomyces europaeiscabiei]
MSRAHLIRRIATTAVLPAALAGAVLVSGTGGGLTTGAQHQSLDGQTQLVDSILPTDGMSYHLRDISGGAVAETYNSIINDIRGRVRGARLYNNIILTQGANDFFDVTLAVGNGENSITLIFNARNLYVVGWRNNRTGVYYRMDGPSRLPGQIGDTQHRNWLNYSDMERAGEIDRGNMGITMGAVQGAVSDMATTTNSRTQARALLILVQAFAEGARYDFISYRVSQAIRNNGVFHTGSSSTVSGNGSGQDLYEVTGLELENNWQTLSDAVTNATHNHTNPNVRIGDARFTTLQAIDAQMAFALHK